MGICNEVDFRTNNTYKRNKGSLYNDKVVNSSNRHFQIYT